MYSTALTGSGYYVPAQVLTNKELESVVDTSDEWIVSRSGIRERRIAGPLEATSDLAFFAAEAALRDAGLAAEDLSAIIVATVTPDMAFPATACLVQARLGAKQAAAFDISAACTGFVYAMQLVKQGIASGEWQHVLVVGAETLSRVVDWQDRATCVLFGDGAGAAVFSRDEGQGALVVGVHLGADGDGADLLFLPGGGSREPASAQSLAGRRHYIQMNGQEVYKFAVRIVETAGGELLKKLGLGFQDVDYLVPHQANLRIIEGFAKRIKLPMERIAVNLDRFGNISAASLPIALHQSRTSLCAGNRVLLVGFGGGLTWGAAMLEWRG